jgi:hypothetical protein
MQIDQCEKYQLKSSSFYQLYRTFHAIYCDPDQHFDNEILREFLKSQDIVIDYSSLDAFNSTDLIEMSNILFEEVLRKRNTNSNSSSNTIWDLRLAKIIKAIDESVISYLKISLSTINFERVQKIPSINSIILHLSE